MRGQQHDRVQLFDAGPAQLQRLRYAVPQRQHKVSGQQRERQLAWELLVQRVVDGLEQGGVVLVRRRREGRTDKHTRTCRDRSSPCCGEMLLIGSADGYSLGYTVTGTGFALKRSRCDRHTALRRSPSAAMAADSVDSKRWRSVAVVARSIWSCHSCTGGATVNSPTPSTHQRGHARLQSFAPAPRTCTGRSFAGETGQTTVRRQRLPPARTSWPTKTAARQRGTCA